MDRVKEIQKIEGASRIKSTQQLIEEYMCKDNISEETQSKLALLYDSLTEKNTYCVTMQAKIALNDNHITTSNATDNSIIKRVKEIQMSGTERKFRHARKLIEEYISKDNIKQRTQIKLSELYDSITTANIDFVMKEAKRALNDDPYIFTRDELAQMAINLDSESTKIFLWISTMLIGLGCYFTGEYRLAAITILFPVIMIWRLVHYCYDLDYKIKEGTRMIENSSATVIF